MLNRQLPYLAHKLSMRTMATHLQGAHMTRAKTKSTEKNPSNQVTSLPTLFQQARLPHSDERPLDRNRSLTVAQGRYQYNYEVIPGVAMINALPLQEHPSFEWLSTVGKELIEVLWNQHLSQAAWRRHHWLGLYRYSLKENLSFLKEEFAHYIEHILPALFNEFGTDPKGTYHTLKAVISAWRPDMVQSLEDISSAFSGLIPLLVFNEPKGPPKKLADYKTLFQSIKPPAITDRFQSDESFGYLRVAGQNPMSLQLAPAHWKDKISFSNEQFQNIKAFAEDTLEAALAENRLYLLDYPYLENLSGGDFPVGQKYISNPTALLAIPKGTERKIPLPIAIQCDPKADLVFTPEDGYSWMMAKTMVEVADNNHHELVSHLAYTHLVMEAFVMATHRQLAPNHPVYLLLTPHFEGTAFINWAAQEYLIAPGNFVDQLLAAPIGESQKMAINALKDYNFNDQMLPNNLKARGMNSDAIHYPYRDDAQLLWESIFRWVKNYLALYYPSEKELKLDKELAAWAEEIHSNEGGRIQGFGDDNKGHINSLSYLSEAITMIIFTASVQHAAVNFPQRTIMSYTPAGPLASYAPAPEKRNHNRAQWRSQFAPLEIANQQLLILDLLGSVYHGRLGHYAAGHFQDPAVLPLVQSFVIELKEIEEKIRSRNADDVMAGLIPYETLLPSLIPQSINI